MLRFSYSCNDGSYSYFTRNIYNRYVESFQTFLGQDRNATTIWRPGLTNTKLQIKTNPAFPLFLFAY